jgi:hypothetical protein
MEEAYQHREKYDYLVLFTDNISLRDKKKAFVEGATLPPIIFIGGSHLAYLVNIAQKNGILHTFCAHIRDIPSAITYFEKLNDLPPCKKTICKQFVLFFRLDNEYKSLKVVNPYIATKNGAVVPNNILKELQFSQMKETIEFVGTCGATNQYYQLNRQVFVNLPLFALYILKHGCKVTNVTKNDHTMREKVIHIELNGITQSLVIPYQKKNKFIKLIETYTLPYKPPADLYS